VLAHAEQIRAAQQLTDEQVGELIWKTIVTLQGFLHPCRTISTCKHKQGTQQQQQQRGERGESQRQW